MTVRELFKRFSQPMQTVTITDSIDPSIPSTPIYEGYIKDIPSGLQNRVVFGWSGRTAWYGSMNGYDTDIVVTVTEDTYSESFRKMSKRKLSIIEDKEYTTLRTRKRSIKEGDASKKTNYAVQVRDMNSGYIHLFTGTKADCLKLEKILDDFTREMEDWQDDLEYESNMDWLNDEVLSNYGHIEEINYREIDDNNNYWDYGQPYHIINDYYFDMYL